MTELEKSTAEMSDYCNDHKLELCNNFGLNYLTKGNGELAKYLHQNFNTMDDEEMSIMLKKCLSTTDKKRILLEYELKYFNETPRKMTLEDYTKYVHMLLKRYSWKAGGFLLEDHEWTMENHGSSVVVFKNSMHREDLDNYESLMYIDRITRRLNTICGTISATFDYVAEGSVVWITIKVVDKETYVEPTL
jgi:hypothetical protein